MSDAGRKGLWDVVSEGRRDFVALAKAHPIYAVGIGFLGVLAFIDHRHATFAPAVAGAVVTSELWTAIPSGYVILIMIFLLYRQRECEKREYALSRRVTQIVEKLEEAETKLDGAQDTGEKMFSVLTKKQRDLIQAQKAAEELRAFNRRKLSIPVEFERRRRV